MDEKLKNWCQEHKINAVQTKDGVCNIVTVGEDKYLFVRPNDENKIIDEDFALIVTDEEFAALDAGTFEKVLFSFGGMYFWTKIKPEKNRYNEIIYKPDFNDFRYIGTIDEEKIMDFNHLGVHSEYELLNGSASTDLWAKKAKFMGCEYLGIADRNTLAGSLAFQSSCKKFGIKPILGETITVAKEYDEKEDLHETFELKLYVNSYEGWKNLLWINKLINCDYKGFIPDEDLYEFGKGLICVIPPESEFNTELGSTKRAMLLLKTYQESFDDVFYQIDTVETTSPQLFQKHLKNLDTYLAKFYQHVKPILINDSYYVDKDAAKLKQALNQISGKVRVETETSYFKTFGDTLQSYSEWYDDCPELMDIIMEAAENCNEFCKTVNFQIEENVKKLPRFDVEDAVELFFSEIEKGINERLVGQIPDEDFPIYMQQIETECNVIIPNDIVDYFLINWDIMRYCRESGILRGVGRGSVCGSLLAYLLYMTDVDPLKYDLMFERFINETRVSGERAKYGDSMPDVDNDFPTKNRNDVKEYIRNKYGTDYFGAIATFTRMKLKTCLKDFSKNKSISFDQMNRLTKDIDDQQEYSWGDVFRFASQSKILYDFVQKNPDVILMTKYALGQARAASVHPSASLIVPTHHPETNEELNIYSWIPVKIIDGVLVSEWEGKYIDKAGFLKEDLLGLTQLDKFQMIKDLLKKNYKFDLDLMDIPLDDEDTFGYFQKGWNEDIFQFGSQGLTNYSRQVKPDCIEDLIAMTALFRPGAMEMGSHEKFSQIKKGKLKPQYDIGMEEITKSTFGLFTYQEQIMKGVVVGGLSAVESDNVRTAMKKFDKQKLGQYEEKFKHGYAEVVKGKVKDEQAYVDEVWHKLMAFSGYGFNKSHSVAYSMTSYWSQYLKVKYPLEFWTTSFHFASEGEIPYRLAEMRKANPEIEVRPPDINQSTDTFACNPKTKQIFFSLGSIKGIGDVAVKNLMEMQRNGKYFSLEEFLDRRVAKIGKTVTQALVMAGAFDLVEEIEKPTERIKLLNWLETNKAWELPKMVLLAEKSELKKDSWWITEQRRLTGYGSVDYLQMVMEAIGNKRIRNKFIDAETFVKQPDDVEVCLAGKLLNFKEQTTKKGAKMASASLESNNVIVDITIWPQQYEKIGDELVAYRGKTIAVNGKVRKDSYKNQKRLFSFEGTNLYLIG
jgi:DNA polymerase-3 subunit alpha